MRNRNNFLRVLNYHFGMPEEMTWSYLLFISSIFTALFFALKCALNKFELKIPTTSLVGFSIFMPIFILFTFVLPALLLCKKNSRALVGNYTGAGILVIAFLSGFPLMLVNTIFSNIVTWLFLRLGSKIVYPAFFFYSGTNTKAGAILSIITEGVIPAFGYSLFFYGILWSRFRHSQKKLAYLVIIVAYTLFSMDIIGFIASIITAWWCTKLRDKTDGVYAPFLCMVSVKLWGLLLGGLVSRIDVYSVQTASDIPSTYFYAALPAILIAVILIAFFTRTMDDYYYKYMGKETIYDDLTLPSITRNLNFGLIIAALIMITIWIFIAQGVHL